MTARRSEAEVVADTVYTLLAEGHLQSQDMDRIRELFGLTRDDAEHARKRSDDRMDAPVPTSGRFPEHSSPRPDREPPPRFRVKNGKQEWKCSGAGVHAPHWAPAAEFGDRSDRPGEKRSACKDAMKSYQRQRTAMAQAQPFINQLGIMLDVDEDSVVIGLKCSSCRQPFKPGDTVKLHGTPHHAGCLQEALGHPLNVWPPLRVRRIEFKHLEETQ